MSSLNELVETVEELKAVKKQRELLKNALVNMVNADGEAMPTRRQQAMSILKTVLTKEQYKKEVQWFFPSIKGVIG